MKNHGRPLVNMGYYYTLIRIVRNFHIISLILIGVTVDNNISLFVKVKVVFLPFFHIKIEEIATVVDQTLPCSKSSKLSTHSNNALRLYQR
ncbi:hypothetical protein RIR_jg440.t1 [Rhizophagus irregularis DAOM 181602=DAOM 197198]|jgi:hypothetical protein|uniref:Uncharacterized protein n=1 Tax=Rhizophagus irregularis TaxID=588596 RepID=A0A2N1NW71_9GLOM|nr:hypothetical protein RhiirC2_572624 [Rhizophagus irregularis]GET59152.1 hypothetical protein RIR_jg440.t1 [Rhizophagus irregularis DAOM 181602=DAOM 197198]